MLLRFRITQRLESVSRLHFFFFFFFLTQDLLELGGFPPQTTQRRKCARSPERTHATLSAHPGEQRDHGKEDLGRN